MEFLYKMYSNQYFALILFSVIAVLLVLFIIVLIAAMRDTKKRKLEILNNMEQEDLSEVEDKVKASVMEEVKTSEETPAFTEESKEVELETPQVDITLDTPTNDNPMTDLLNEFETPEIDLLSDGTDLDALIAQVAPETKEASNTASINEVDDIDDDFELPAIKKVETVEEISADELPKMNMEEVVEEVSDETKSEIPEIDLEKTGVLNFSNVETESYDIKK